MLGVAAEKDEEAVARWKAKLDFDFDCLSAAKQNKHKKKSKVFGFTFNQVDNK